MAVSGCLWRVFHVLFEVKSSRVDAELHDDHGPIDLGLPNEHQQMSS